MIHKLRNLIAGAGLALASSAATHGPGRPIRARYDAAQTTPENRRHWSAADHLSADAAQTPEIRARLRSRARYEVQNNAYARGIVDTLGNYVVGTGPRLQVLSDDSEANRRIERAFAEWAKEIDLAEKLRQLRMAQAESGEAFAVLTTNAAINSPVKLDLRLIEADQVTTPWTALTPQPGLVDGIVHDEAGNPLAYHVLRAHPGDQTWPTAVGEYDVVDADLVLHVYRATRPAQSRGVPELTPALPLFAQLRRYTLAVLGAAEQAALPSGVIQTDAPAEGEAATIDPMDQVEMNRGEWLTMPAGWKIGQIQSEQPTTQYGDFQGKILAEIARCLNMPFNVAAGDSSSYNYASGRLDHQSFFRSIRIDQQRFAQVVLDPLMLAWLSEAQLIEGLLPQAVRTTDAAAGLAHQWFWDGLEHVDPAKEATAQKTRLETNTTTLAAEYARQGLDWEQELRQRGREVALMRELDLTPDTTVSEGQDQAATDDEAEENEPEEVARG